jgi:hypothetical protein
VPPPSAEGGIFLPSTSSAVAMPSVLSLRAEYHVRLSVPPESFGSSALPARAPIARSVWSPPKIAVWPLSSTSVVARTTFFVRPTALISALSSRGVVCSVNWTSNAIAFAPSLRSWSRTRAW